MVVENSPRPQKPVEIAIYALRAIREVERPPKDPGLPPKAVSVEPCGGKGYFTRRCGSDDGGIAGVEGCRIKTPLPVE